MKKYNKENIPLAKKLRKNMTPWERKLWYDFLRQYPVRFQRQKAIGNYIADFYCAKAKLVIELDGGGHYEPEQARADEIRTADLGGMDLSVLRICNLDVDRNFKGVCEHIDNMVQQSLPQSASLTAPSSEGALVCSANETINQDRRTDRPMTQKRIIALGFFDGVHLGHQVLLRECRRMAQEMGATAAAVTFATHPEALVVGRAPALLNTAEDRQRLLLAAGMAEVIVLPFDQRMRTMPWQAFFRMLTTKYQAAGLVCGHDYRFGSRGAGNAQVLREACAREGIPCAVIPEQKIDGITISSTHIRTLVEAGDMDNAARFLGHPHIFTGFVVPGHHLGRTIGVPTANLCLPEGLANPRRGVYACRAVIDGVSYAAVTNVGTRPTVSGQNVTVEPWILDFEGDLYGRQITLEFHKFLRPEKKFDSLEALREEIRKNAEETKDFFKKS